MSDVAYDPNGSFNAGYGRVSQFINDLGRQRAGRALASGDYAGASRSLYGAGDLEGGQQIQAQGRAAETAKKAQELEATLRIARALKGVRQQGGDVVSALDGYRPMLGQFGVDDAQYGQIRSLIASNPQALDQIEQLAGQQQRELEIRQRGRDTIVLDPTTGALVQEYKATPEDYTLGTARYDGATNQPVAVAPREPEYIQRNPQSDLIEIPGTPPIGQPSTTSGSTDPVAIISTLIPDVQFNSGLRTTDQNRRAGGAQNSFHLRGQAVDIAPPRGITQAQLRQQLESQGVRVTELLNEGDHWHIAWDGEARAPNFGRGERTAPRVVSAGQPQAREQVRLLSEDEKRALGLPAGGAYQQGADGRISAIGGSNERFTQDQRQAAGFTFRLQNATRTLDRLASQGITRPSPQILLGDGTINRNIRSESDRRFLQAAKEWLAPVLRRDTGAAVTDGELITYGDIYIPMPTDSPAVIAQKAEARRVAEQALRGQAGAAYDELLGTVNAGQPERRTRLGFTPTEAQERRRQSIVPNGTQSGAPAGSIRNPFIANPRDPSSSMANARRAAATSRRSVYVIDTNGNVVEVLPPAGRGR